MVSDLQAHRPRRETPGKGEGAAQEFSGVLDPQVFLRILNKHRYMLLFTVLAVEAVVALVTFRTTPLYPAQSKVIIQDDTSRLLGTPDPLGFGYMYSEEFFQTQYRRLNSRPVLERAIQSEKMDEWAEFQGLGDLPGYLAGEIQLKPVRESRMVEVLYEGPDPEHAATLVNAVVDNFEREFHEARLKQSRGNTTSLSGSIEKIEAEMREYERQIQEFMSVHSLVTTKPEQSPAFARLEEFSRREARLQADLYELEARVKRMNEVTRDPSKFLYLEGVANDDRLWKYDEVYVRLIAEKAHQELLYSPNSLEMETLKRQLAAVEEARIEVGRQIGESYVLQRDRIKTALDEVRKEMTRLEAEVQRLNELNIEYERLQSRLKQTQDRFQEVLTGRSRGEVFGRMEVAPVLIVERPVVATSPSRPRVLRNLTLGVLVGLLLGAGLAFLMEVFDDSIRSTQDLEEHAAIPCLGLIPHMKEVEKENERALLMYHQPQSPAAEAFRSLRATVDLQIPHAAQGCRVFLMSSAQPNEGKTTIALNLSMAHVLNGRRTLLIVGDMRKRLDLTPLGIAEDAPGLFEYLSGRVEKEGAVHRTEGYGLDVVPTGSGQANPAELLGHKRMAELLQWARQMYEIVIVDAPPFLAVADALILSALADHSLVVVHAGRTGRAMLRRIMQICRESRVDVLGGILNDCSGHIEQSEGPYSYYYQYGYGYGSKERGEKRKSRENAKSSVGD
ncbi:MAG: polysaccharide biosynthesis tyrosine autokinase [Planctomycetota bacterium]|nr:polysaccharide biosynthesis tyrosine autokinase [Planctomycetota bacterium]